MINFQTPQGVHGIHWPSTQPPKAHILLIHGMVEHAARYQTWAQHLADLGYWVTASHLPGHGPHIPADQRGHTGLATWSSLVSDQWDSLQQQRQDHLIDAPVIIMGHSMGSFIALALTARYASQCIGSVLIGSSYESWINITSGRLLTAGFQALMGPASPARLIHKIIFNGFNRAIPSPITEYDWISDNKDHVRDYQQDPCCGMTPSLALYRCLFEGLHDLFITQRFLDIPRNYPLCWLSGQDDPMRHTGRGLDRFMQQLTHLGFSSIRYLQLAGRHEVLQFQPPLDQLQPLTDWLADRIKGS